MSISQLPHKGYLNKYWRYAYDSQIFRTYSIEPGLSAELEELDSVGLSFAMLLQF